ncbi:hypothetical protein FRC0069_01041 [Corynebacterium diphtheriae]|nr:hypothetical protein CIP101352_01156 [Corynebacterium diphtheriae]CAB0643770.1 hypothetical protein CIP107561_00973 [Corynebacterium diphtheriae]CAB0646074.1 hypothetical protein CIP107567_01099 [Corynebacterium diphtheriae]CAB0692810.1 hypothetical protein FRC0069_01041 [Corynebacterium diphtheriae]CAB0730202.1 hypothetical protein FRC0095_01086 [Corynebacterium diphtheriae]
MAGPATMKKLIPVTFPVPVPARVPELVPVTFLSLARVFVSPQQRAIVLAPVPARGSNKVIELLQ